MIRPASVFLFVCLFVCLFCCCCCVVVCFWGGWLCLFGFVCLFVSVFLSYFFFFSFLFFVPEIRSKNALCRLGESEIQKQVNFVTLARSLCC